MCAPEGGATFLIGDKIPPRDEHLRRGQQAQIGDIGPQARRDEYVPAESENDEEGESRISDLP